MGMIGRYLDSRRDHIRDRIIEAQGWCRKSFSDEDGNRCMLGHAEQFTDSIHASDDDEWEIRHARCPTIWANFDNLVRRVGLDEAVRLVKARAARRNRMALPEPEMAEVR